MVKINLKDFEQKYNKIEDYDNHYELRDDVIDYLVEYKGYDSLEIGEDTDFEVQGKYIVVEVEQ